MQLDMLSPAQRRALVNMASMKRRTGWKAHYEWTRLRVVFEEIVGDAWEEDDGRVMWLSQTTTGRVFWVRIWTFWWRRREILRDRKLPKARLLR